MIKKVSKKFIRAAFVQIVFVGMVDFVYIILSHIITESQIILSKYLPFLQLHIEEFQRISFFHGSCSLGFLHSTK